MNNDHRSEPIAIGQTGERVISTAVGSLGTLLVLSKANQELMGGETSSIPATHGSSSQSGLTTELNANMPAGRLQKIFKLSCYGLT